MADPDFADALDRLLDAVADTAEFADGLNIGRSREASIRRLAAALSHLERISAELVRSSSSTGQDASLPT
jgi:hypothetical protein